MAEPSAVVLVENKTVKRESTYKRPSAVDPNVCRLFDPVFLAVEEKPDTCCGSCCYSCIGCFFGCCLSCFECTCGSERRTFANLPAHHRLRRADEKYVSLSTKLMAASFDSKLTWPKEKVPLPEDGEILPFIDWNSELIVRAALQARLTTTATTRRTISAWIRA